MQWLESCVWTIGSSGRDFGRNSKKKHTLSVGSQVKLAIFGLLYFSIVCRGSMMPPSRFLQLVT